jgi:ribosomal-protein-alanine N-acetyltransferase
VRDDIVNPGSDADRSDAISPSARVAPLATARMRLLALDADAVEAWVARDAGRLTARTGARFALPLEAPPLVDDVLPFVRDRLRALPDEVGWWCWLLVDRASGDAVGSVGFGGRPDEAGTVVVGYSVYEAHQRRGLATEAVRALAAWVLAQPGVVRLRATVPPWNGPSRQVATRVGMRQVGRGDHPDVGDVLVFDLEGHATRS